MLPGMKTHRAIVAAAGAAALLLAGCATPEARIRRDPERFAGFPPAAQALIREGRIDVGFSPEMVHMALGPPAQQRERVTADGRATIWVYTSSRYRSVMRPVETVYTYRDRRGRLRTSSEWTWIDAGHFVDVARLLVEFREGRVSSIESVTEP
jgi:hypothetical protein